MQADVGSFTNTIPIGFIRQVYGENFGITPSGSRSYPSSSGVAKAITANGNAKIDTSQFKFGGASASFDGSGSYLTTPDSNDWNFGSGDFTIDFWVRFNALPSSGNSEIICGQRTDDATNRWYGNLYNNAGTYQWQFVGAGTLVSVNTTLSTATWYHVAVVRSGNNILFFQAGTQVGTSQAYSATLGDYTSALYIGSYMTGTSSFLNGWLDEFRVTKGLARWTSNFTPLNVAYTSDSNTVLLLHMDGTNGSTTFTDDSPFTGPVPYGFNVKASPTQIQIVVTLMYSWTGSGAPPQGSITIAGPGGTPSYSESAGAVYDRTSIAVSGSTSTYNLIHRVTFTITAPGSAQVWTAYVSLSGVSSYTLTIEVS